MNSQSQSTHPIFAIVRAILRTRVAQLVLVYSAILLLLFASASLGLDVHRQAKRLILPIAFSLAALLALLCYAYSALRLAPSRAERRKSMFVFPMSIFGAGLCLVLAEIMLPRTQPSYTDIQVALQSQLQRRGRSGQSKMRDHILRSRYNMFGWADPEWDTKSVHRPIIFIGDSFLEVRSATNLAESTRSAMRSKGANDQIINLSKDATGPEFYRFLFEEVATMLEPEHVVVFLYEGNDLSTDFRFLPYTHPRLHVTTVAISELKNRADIAARLRQGTDQSFTSCRGFISTLGSGLNENDALLAYLTAYAWSTPSDLPPGKLRSIAALTEFLQKLRQWYWRHLCSPRNQKSGDWRDFYPEYKRVFDLPQEQRLEAIADIMSRRYTGGGSREECLSVLRSQSAQFTTALTEQCDMIYYLLPAIANAIRANRQDVCGQYANLFAEMSDKAKTWGGGLTVVLIPEASFADSTFRDFWRPMVDFNEHFAAKHELYLGLRDRLAADMPVVDLLRFTNQLDGAYWLFDGHFNSRGNAFVGQLLADYLTDHEFEGILWPGEQRAIPDGRALNSAHEEETSSNNPLHHTADSRADASASVW
jgi:hypothetical protein